MTKGKAGHYWQRISAPPTGGISIAVVLTSGSSYSIPIGATTMKAWAVGGGAGQRSAGGVAYKTWPVVIPGETVTYSIGAGGSNGSARGNDTSLTFGETTIIGQGGTSAAGGTGSGYSGGDGGANGGIGQYVAGTLIYVAGAVGGNGVADNGTPSSVWSSSVLRMPAADVSGLLAAVGLAGTKATEDGGSEPAFGSGGGDDPDSAVTKGPGIGGGGVVASGGRTYRPGGSGAVVLYFT